MKDFDRSHAVLEAALLALESLAAQDAAQSPRPGECRAARQVLDCFEQTVPEHHRDEERRLFPELRLRAAQAGRPELASTLYELEMEHERMERLYRDSLRPALRGIAQGSAAALDREAVAHLAWLCRRHIGMETQVLEPLGDRDRIS
jgi:hemerythrin-like domain-containing protein